MNTSKLEHARVIGDSRAMRLLTGQIGLAAGCDLTTLVTGESGTGKELVALALHQKSQRSVSERGRVRCVIRTEICRVRLLVLALSANDREGHNLSARKPVQRPTTPISKANAPAIIDSTKSIGSHFR